MINDIIQAISTALYAEFGNDYTIYTEHIEQGLKQPCFFVFCISQSETAKLNVRFFAEHTFVIQYFAKKGNMECWNVLEKLHRLLEFIKLENGSIIAGTNRKGEVKYDKLYFFVNYDFYMTKQKENDELMEVLKIHEKTNRKTLF